MIHVMHLNPAKFSKMEHTQKTVEMRIRDGKRKRVKTGDTIFFKHVS